MGDEGAAVSDRTCESCGAPDPPFLRWIDATIADYFQRTTMGTPGRTAHAARYCDSEACRAAIEATYGPRGNGPALRRLTDELAAKGLDADDNEVRLAALCVHRGDHPPLLASPLSVMRITGLS